MTSNFEIDLNFYEDTEIELEHAVKAGRVLHAIPLVRDWDGISLLFHWDHLAGNPETVIVGEIDFYISRNTAGCNVAFEEDRAINEYRINSSELEQQFYSLLTQLCEELEIPFCIYGDEIALETVQPNLDTVRDLLATGQFSTGGVPACVVFDTRQINPIEFKEHIERRGRELLISTNGFGVLRLDHNREY